MHVSYILYCRRIWDQGCSAPEGDQASVTVVTEKTKTPGKKGKFNIEDSMIGP